MDIDKLPAWARRALDPNTPMTEARETVRTMSIERGDFIQFDSEAEATAFSKKLSNMIARKRPMIMQGD